MKVVAWVVWRVEMLEQRMVDWTAELSAALKAVLMAPLLVAKLVGGLGLLMVVQLVVY